MTRTYKFTARSKYRLSDTIIFAAAWSRVNGRRGSAMNEVRRALDFMSYEYVTEEGCSCRAVAMEDAMTVATGGQISALVRNGEIIVAGPPKPPYEGGELEIRLARDEHIIGTTVDWNNSAMHVHNQIAGNCGGYRPFIGKPAVTFCHCGCMYKRPGSGYQGDRLLGAWEHDADQTIWERTCWDGEVVRYRRDTASGIVFEFETVKAGRYENVGGRPAPKAVAEVTLLAA